MKGIQIGREEIKLFPFEDDVFLYIEKPRTLSKQKQNYNWKTNLVRLQKKKSACENKYNFYTQITDSLKKQSI